MTVRNKHDVQITSGQSLSSVATLGRNESLVSVELPAGFTTASITFLTSAFSTPNSLYDANVEYAISGAASRTISVDPVLFLGSKLVQIRSGLESAPVNQSSTVTISLITAEL